MPNSVDGRLPDATDEATTHLSNGSRRSLGNLAYLAENSVETANRVSTRIEAEIRDLVAMPGKGHFRADVSHADLRFWRIYSWIVAYRFDDETLTVVRVVHGHRDFRQVPRGQ